MESESEPPRLLPALTIPKPPVRPTQSRDSPTGLLASLDLMAKSATQPLAFNDQECLVA